ncbi:MAG: recombinase family protein [Thiotrichales bacterium]|nr:recombinase family protein [Thiotrichales bacterium]
MNSKITSEHLRRSAAVYIRQSTPTQVLENTESQRRQYELVEGARTAGFASVTVIDDDLGRSGAGAVERPGFQKLAAEVCTGAVGAVFCIEASRLARNGRDWHYLIDLCALTGALVIDPDGVYDPRLTNDRLLLGLKGTMSKWSALHLENNGKSTVIESWSAPALRTQSAGPDSLTISFGLGRLSVLRATGPAPP